MTRDEHIAEKWARISFYLSLFAVLALMVSFSLYLVVLLCR